MRLLEQDMAMLTQHEFERRQAAAQAVVHSLEQSLTGAERLLMDGPLPPGMIRLHMRPDGASAVPGERMHWVPTAPPLPSAATEPFKDLEPLEHQGDAERALRGYQRLVRSPTEATRTGALLRVARVERQRRRWDEALRAYRSLSTITGTAIEGVPADLIARRAICAVLEDSGRIEELAGEAGALAADFEGGRWTLDRPAWQLTARDIERWTGRSLADPERKALSVAAETLWHDRPEARTTEPPTVTRRFVVGRDMPITVLVRRAGDDLFAIGVAPSLLHAWGERAADAAVGSGERLALIGPAGEVLAGSAPPGTPPEAPVLRRSAGDTGLPWTVVLSPAHLSAVSEQFAGRRRLLAVGLAAILLLLAGGSYFLWRVIQRELAVARLQTEFVAAVSHEFRTPLASLRHLADLLDEDEDDGMPTAQRRTFYKALGRNTDRLHRLVESLLDYARMEGGRKRYDLQPVDVGELAARLVVEFRQHIAPDGLTIELDSETAAGAAVSADAAALSSALWNLLDNAVKYSRGSQTVAVSIGRVSGDVVIAVRDSGLGIPQHEQREIFSRFVRGRQATELGIRGTGLGLAMVVQIVQAHGGTVTLESEEGVGSTFRLVLPAVSTGHEEAPQLAHS